MNDLILNGKAFGSVAQRLLACNMDVRGLRTNATLQKDEWKHLDEAIVKAAQQRLIGVADLRSRGLEYRIPNGLGKTVLEYEDQSDIEAAQLDMEGLTKGRRDRVVFSLKNLPLPIIHKDFQISLRVLTASRERGMPLDTTNAELASRKVSERAEELLFTGASSFAFGGGTLYGYMDFPSRNTLTLSQNWDASGKTGEEILDDVRAMKQASIDDRHYGPWVLYVPTNYEVALDDDYKANSDKTIRQRILEITGIADVKVADKLTADNVLLVEMSAETARMVIGLDITPVEWAEEGGMAFSYKVMSIMVPQLRADQDGRCGIVHLA